MAHRPLVLLFAGALVCAAPLALAQKETGQQAPAAPRHQDPPTESQVQNRKTYQGHEFLTARDAGAWRASDLMNKDVRDRAGDSVGKVKDLLIGRDGRLIAMVVEAGGVLGVGGHLVAVPADMVTVLGAEPHAGAGDPQGTAGVNPGARTTTQPDNRPMVNDRGTDDVPRRIVVNMTRQELENAPKFESRPDR